MPSAAAQRPPLAIRIDPRFIAPAGPRISNVYQPPPAPPRPRHAPLPAPVDAPKPKVGKSCPLYLSRELMTPPLRQCHINPLPLKTSRLQLH